MAEHKLREFNNDNQVTVMFYNYGYQSKPDKKEIIRIQFKLKRKTMQLQELAEALVNGATVRPGVLEDGKAAIHWTEQQVFGLDFDKGSSVKDVYNRAVSKGLVPSFIYTTFSHQESFPKFRVLFCTKEVITDGEVRDKIQATLMGLFSDSDEHCSNRDRVFLGGNGKEVLCPDYDARIDADEVLKLWKDEFATYLPTTSKEKKNVQRKSAGERNKKAYTISEEGDKIPYSTKQFRDTARFNLRCLEKCFAGKTWVEGAHRERFIFIYYNVAKLLYGSKKAREMAIEKSVAMQEPLSESEFFYAITRTDAHEEEMDWHGDGVYTYRPATIVERLELTEQQAEAFGFFDAKNRKDGYREHQEQAAKRDRIIAELYLSGLGYKAIAKALPEEFKCSAVTVMNVVKRLGICGQKGHMELLETIDFEERRRFSRYKTLTERLFAVDKATLGESFVNGKCQALYEKHMAAKGRSFPEETVLQMLRSGKNVLLCGGGGTGKSTIISKFYYELPAEERHKTIVVTPTGVASDNLQIPSRTIHSTFQMAPEIVPAKEKVSLPLGMWSMRRLIIDEIGMVRADVFDYLMRCVEAIEQSSGEKVQVIVVGDFGQIMPVLAKKEQEEYEAVYGKGTYAFQGREWNKKHFVQIVLRENHRVKKGPLTAKFVEICDALQFGSEIALTVVDKLLLHGENADAVYLCATKRQVDFYNEKYSCRFKDKKIYEAYGTIVEDGPKECLELEEGMRIITLKNTKYYKNGSIGIITKLLEGAIQVRFERSQKEHVVFYEDFEADGKIMYQLPIAIAGALTVNKAQGLTLTAVNIVPGFFSPGSLYTALTRCKKVEDMRIVGHLKRRDLIVNVDALNFCV